MKNKKIIFLVATVCCLVVCWLCFGAWSLADTELVASDFSGSASNLYIYIVPSSSVTGADFPNLAISFVYTAVGSSTVVTDTSVLNELDDRNGKGCYALSSNSFGITSTVRVDVSISAVDNGIGTYFISAAYIKLNSTTLQPISSFYSNNSFYSFSPSSNRTLILFVDKYSTVSQAQYDELLQRYEDLEYDFSDLESDYDDLYIEVQEYIALYNQELAINTALNTRIEELQARIDSLESGGNALDFIGTAFEKVGDILQIEILPNITIGTIVAVPLILGVVFLVLRLVRGE